LFNAKITAVAHHAPEKVVTNFDLEKVLDTSDEWIRTRTGIRERRVAAKGEATSDLAAVAARKVLDQRRISASALDCIIVATVTPDMFFPSTACVLQEKIGASRACGFKDNRVVRNIDGYANTTAATLPIGLSESYVQRRIKRGDLVLMASFGAGSSWGSVLTRWSF
jgi:3-oxoacyl-[acyl-carrier-protein] synthase III